MRISRRRFLRGAAITGGVLAGGCTARSSQIETPDTVRGRWSTWGYDTANTRHRATGASDREQTGPIWRTGVGPKITSTPTVGEQHIYVTAVDGGVSALSKRDGSVAWSWSDGRTVRSSPAVAGDIVIFGTREAVLALSIDTGSPVWTYEAGEGSYASSPCLDGESVYIGSGTDLVALDASSGAERWRFGTDGQITAPPSTDGGRVYVSSSDDSVYAVDADSGDYRWGFETGGGVHAAPLVDSGRVYVGGLDGVAYALDSSTGAAQWTLTVGPVYTSLAKTGDSLLVPSFTASASRGVYCIRDGEVAWEFRPDSLGSASAPAVGESSVYVGHKNGRLYNLALDSGAVRWSYDTGSASVDGSPSVVDNAVLVGDNSGTLHALTI